MELETLFTSSKWEILQHLATESLSPLELAERSSTSLANISQQLKLLEMAGLVTSRRLPNRDKGQPRLKYQLANQSYLIAAAEDFTEKKLFKLNDRNKITLRIWFYDDEDTRYALEKAFWHLEPELHKIQQLGVERVTENTITMSVLSGELADLPALHCTTPSGKKITIEFNSGVDVATEKTHILFAN